MLQLPNTPDNQKYLLGFTLLPDIGTVRFAKLMKFFPSLESAWNASAGQYKQAGVEERIANQIVAGRKKINLDKALSSLEHHGITLLSPHFSSSDYPPQLEQIKGAPFALFCRGNISLLQKKQLAIVGTRRPSDYGIQVTKKISAEIAHSGLVITSGMAQGIDSVAHETALENNCPTIAVLGNSVDENVIRKSVSYDLAGKILSHDGLLVSEYPPGYEAQKFTFPNRNRIISGLSLGVLVVQAGEKSGSLITARYALEQNREVFAIPGNIFFQGSMGTHQLLKQGAALTTSAKDILEAFNFIYSPAASAPKELVFESKTEESIYKKLSLEPIHINKLSILCKLDTPAISTTLSLMELKGIVRNVGGGNFVRM